MIAATSPFVKVAVRVLLLPLFTFPKLNPDDGVRVITPCPVPDKLTVCEPEASESVAISDAESTPALVGAKTTFTVHCDPTDKLEPQLLLVMLN